MSGRAEGGPGRERGGDGGRAEAGGGGEWPWRGRRLHFVGVGGAGMSAYARAAWALGAEVSGSDHADGPYLERLRRDGVLEAHIGHAAANVPAGTPVEVIHSSAVPADNPERAAARERGLPDRPRAELLGELTRLRRTIAVAGAHGKTTTSAMLVHVLAAAGLDPSYLVGGTVGPEGVNADWRPGEWLVVEADESDRSMLALDAEIAVLTNVELDHHAAFGSELELREAFRAFLAPAPRAVIWNRPELLALRDGPVVAFDVEELALERGGSRFCWRGHEVRLAVPGRHNALDALAALEAGRLAGAEPERAAASLASFRGAGRRFQQVGRTSCGALVYDDYAHNPSKVAAALAAARTLEPGRLVAVFQPHLYSRTRMVAAELGRALALADLVVVTEVYAARERPAQHPGVSGRLVAQATADVAGGREVMWLPAFADVTRVLAPRLLEDDVVMVMGAGDVDELGRLLAGAHAS